MTRPAAWISSLAVGFALATQGMLVDAQTVVPAGARSSAHVAPTGGSNGGQPTDYVVEIPSEDDSSGDPADPSAGGSAGLEEELTHEDVSQLPTSNTPSESTDRQPPTEIIKERFTSGSVKIERQVMQDASDNYVNHGPWKMWDEQGKLLAQGQFDHGERTGEWIRWYRVASEVELFSKMPYHQFIGPFISQATFKNGELDGVWIIYDNQMRKISQWAFTNGKRHGASTWWYTDGKKMRECLFRHGDMDEYYMEWAPDGSVRVKETYQAGRKLAEKSALFPGGKKKSLGMYLFARDVEHTPDDWWNCKLLVTNPTGKDEQHGPSTVWHPSGQKALEGEYDHDIQVGQFTWWHSNAQKALEGRYDHGKQEGPWIWWHVNGQKSIQGHYAQGTPTGRWTWWQEDGKIAQSADLSNSEGVVIDVPRALDPALAPRAAMPIVRQPARR